MLTAFPDTGRIEIPTSLAGDLRRVVDGLPLYDNKSFYDVDLQSLVRNRTREACPDGFDWLVAQIAERLARWPYCTVVRGLHFDEGNRLFIGLNGAFGELVAPPYDPPRAQLIHYIQPAMDISSARGGTETERLHTDTADWETPVELISMVCVRADSGGGGRSRVLDVDSAREEVRKNLGTEALNRLETEPFPWQLAIYRGGGVAWRPVFAGSGMCWRRYTVDRALASGGARLSDEALSLLDAFEAVIAMTPRTIDFLLLDGDLLFADNRRTIHARTPISSGKASNRLMIRSWIRATPRPEPGG
jgi:Taurine catabolism dioxygenase TauD, TfdA family